MIAKLDILNHIDMAHVTLTAYTHDGKMLSMGCMKDAVNKMSIAELVDIFESKFKGETNEPS